MMLTRLLRATPYFAVAAVFGAVVGWAFGVSPYWFSAIATSLVFVLIVREIWVTRHFWNSQAHRLKKTSKDKIDNDF